MKYLLSTIICVFLWSGMSAQNEFITEDAPVQKVKKKRKKKEEKEGVEEVVEQRPVEAPQNISSTKVNKPKKVNKVVEPPKDTMELDFDYPQNYSEIRALMAVADTFLYFAIPEDRTRANEQFIPGLVKLLKAENSFEDPLDSLSRKINIIYPRDSSFRVFNWEVNHGNNVTRYYGAIQMPGKELKLYPMQDISEELIENAMDTTLLDKMWYGNIIYHIEDIVLPDNTRAYVTLGLNRNGNLSNKKIMDVLIIKNNKPLQWGIPFIESPEEGKLNRFIIEYNKNANVSMNWDDSLQLVYFDVTKSEINNPAVKYTYIPIGDYAGFKWNGKFWKYQPRILKLVEYQDGRAPTAEIAENQVGLFEDQRKKVKKRKKK